jgi:hypothetical protein
MDTGIGAELKRLTKGEKKMNIEKIGLNGFNLKGLI